MEKKRDKLFRQSPLWEKEKGKKKVRHRCIDSKQVKIVKLINVGTSHKVNLFINILKNHNKNLIGSIHIHKIKGNL